MPEAQAVEAETPAPLLDKPLEKTDKAPPINLTRFQRTEEVVQQWTCICTMDTTPSQVMDQSYWANVSMHLNPGDIINVMPDDMSWKLELHVAGAGKLYAHVVTLHFHDLTSAITEYPELPSIYTFDHHGLIHKWRVLREGKMMKEGFATKSLAHRWAAGHEAAVLR